MDDWNKAYKTAVKKSDEKFKKIEYTFYFGDRLLSEIFIKPEYPLPFLAGNKEQIVDEQAVKHNKDIKDDG